MKKLPFAWLGSKRATKQGAGDKAGLLDLGRRLGLPVPEGVVLLHRLYLLLLEAGVIVQENGRIHCPDPLWLKQVLHKDVRLPPINGTMVVRAAFSLPNEEPVNAIPPHLVVDFDRPQEVADALCGLWTAVADQPDLLRRDLVIQKQVAIKTEGVAVSDPAYQDDLLFGEHCSVVSSQYAVNGEPGLLPQLGRGEGVGIEQPPFAQRLQKLLRGVRRTFGRGAWRVEWADDGEICWLLQVNPLSQPPVRSEVFVPLALPGLRPLPQLGRLLEKASGDLYDDLFRRLDKSLPATRPPLVKMDGDRLCFNQSLLTDTLRHWGLPTASIHLLLGSQTEQPAGWRRGRALRRGRLMLRLGLRQLLTAAQTPGQVAQWRQRAEARLEAETAVSHTMSEFWLAALTAQLCLLGPISPQQPRIAQAQTIWREETAVVMAILSEKLSDYSSAI